MYRSTVSQETAVGHLAVGIRSSGYCLVCGFLVCVNAVVMCGSLHTPLVDTSLFSWGQFVGNSEKRTPKGAGGRTNPHQSGDFPPPPHGFLSSLSFPSPSPPFPRFTSGFRDIVCWLEGSLITLVALNVPFCLGRRLSSSLLFAGICEFSSFRSFVL